MQQPLRGQAEVIGQIVHLQRRQPARSRNQTQQRHACSGGVRRGRDGITPTLQCVAAGAEQRMPLHCDRYRQHAPPEPTAMDRQRNGPTARSRDDHQSDDGGDRCACRQRKGREPQSDRQCAKAKQTGGHYLQWPRIQHERRRPHADQRRCPRPAKKTLHRPCQRPPEQRQQQRQRETFGREYPPCLVHDEAGHGRDHARSGQPSRPAPSRGGRRNGGHAGRSPEEGMECRRAS